MFTTRHHGAAQRRCWDCLCPGSGDGWMYETESVITMVLGLWMVNVVFSLGHRLLNFQSARVTYFVNASLFIYWCTIR